MAPFLSHHEVIVRSLWGHCEELGDHILGRLFVCSEKKKIIIIINNLRIKIIIIGM